MSIESFRGWRPKQLNLPDGGRILCYFYRNNAGMVSLHDENHNVYRLNPAGKVVWQVRRDDSIYGGEAWWEGKHQRARARGEDGAREPFTYIWLEYTDGRPARYSDERGDGVGIAMWEPGCIVRIKSGYGGSLHYILDPETGIAKQIAMPPQRPW